MARLRTTYRCRECGGAEPKWTGRCSACHAWNTLDEEVERPGPEPGTESLGGPATPLPIAEVDTEAWAPMASHLGELDRVLQGGLVPGSVTLIGGEPGIGKSTLLLQALAGLAKSGHRCLYVTAEESAQQVRLRAERLGALPPNLWLVSDTALPHLLGHVDAVEPDIVAVDSIQTVYEPSMSSAPGSVAQVRECAHRLVRASKERAMASVLVGHVTKDGGLAGPRVLEHLVDTVLSFEGERHHALRLLRAVKHRFGSTDGLGLFEMTEAGLDGVPDASALFLADRRAGTSGSVVAPVLDGHRPLLVEVQALVADSNLPTPRRSAQGLDSGRLALVLAVLEQHVGIALGKADVHSVVAGGVKTVEPGADLALALALVSAHRTTPVGDDVVACGEVGLGGELRQVHQTARRLAEAARLGFRRAIVPASAPDAAPGIEVLRAATLRDAVALAGVATGRARRSARRPRNPARSANYHRAMAPRRSAELLAALSVVAPGTGLRAGLDRVLQASMGALVVVGDGPEVLNICSGGFLLDAAFSPQRLSELAKMDGAIILASDASRIARANVHLVPNPNVPTSETGTRHRTAERVARSIDVPVVSVSEDMAIVAVYARDQKHTLEPIPRLLTRANQALQTLERYKDRLDEVTASLSTVEVEDLVTVRDVVTVLQRTEMVRRVAEEIELDIVELGVDGRLVRLQLEELMGGVEDDRRLVIKDYFHEDRAWHVEEALDVLTELGTEDLLDLKAVGEALHLPHGTADLDDSLQPRGYRLLARIPRLPEPVVDRIVVRFGNLQKIMRATIDDLDDVSGVGETRARAIKEGLSRLAETSILDRYT